MIKIVPLNQEQVVSMWGTISTYLSRAIATGQGESTLADYMRKILTNTSQCWALTKNEVIVGVGLTEVLQYNQHKTLHIIAYSGDNFDEQAEVFPTIVAYAKYNGCKSIEQWGRKGWAKTLPKYLPDFEEVYTVMRMDL
jgi:hypothetical protein